MAIPVVHNGMLFLEQLLGPFTRPPNIYVRTVENSSITVIFTVDETTTASILGPSSRPYHDIYIYIHVYHSDDVTVYYAQVVYSAYTPG